MNQARKCDVLIAGAGPAGTAAALFMLKRRPDLAGRIIAIEKSAHPRFKVCAGGLIPKTMLALEELGIALDVPAVDVLRGGARTTVGDVDLSRNGNVLCTIIRRDEFDALLARRAVSAGLEIAERTRVLDVAQTAGGVSVTTDAGIFEAKVLVGADGSGSRVRRAAFGERKETIGRALMTDVPVDPGASPEFVNRRYRFDFRCVDGGIEGYSWSFPCLIGGQPHLNVGIYNQHPHLASREGGEQAAMLAGLDAAFPELHLDSLGRRADSMRWHAFPIRWFDAADRYSSSRVILAGDAAGVDPLMGEGISCAFEHGRHAAAGVDGFLGGDARALDNYDRTLHHGAVGRKLAKLAFAARHFYGPHHRMWFRIANLSRRAQEIGVDWYNGAGHLDETPTRWLLARLARAVLFGEPVR